MAVFFKVIAKVLLGVCKFAWSVISLPIIILIKIIRSFRDNNLIKAFLFIVLFGTVCFFYSVPIMFVHFNFSINDLVDIGGVFSTIYGNDLVKYDGPENFPGYGGDATVNGTFGGSTYKIDLNKLPAKVSLPASYYQSGTVRQRAEMLLIVEEICARPEIVLTPSELLGVFYIEENGNLKATTSIVKTTLPESYNDAGYGGPFQHGIHTWYSSDPGTMIETIGTTYISKLEDPALADSERVKTLAQSSGLKTPDGKRRPNMFYFSDAAYSAGLRISAYKQGKYNGSNDEATEAVFNWVKNNKFPKEINEFLKFTEAYARYSGFNGFLPNSDSKDNCCRGWMPAMYRDLITQKGAINQWSDLATNRYTLLSKLGGSKVGDVSYRGGDGLVASIKMSGQYPEKPKRTFSSYKDYWRQTGGNHLPSHYYSFGAINGGEWMYTGLRALGDVVGTKVENDKNANSTATDGKGGPDGFSGEWTCPLDFNEFLCTSRFHEDRGYKHRGIDIDTGKGDKLYAVQDGTVYMARWDSACTSSGDYSRGGGKMVWIDLDNGYRTVYMHLDKFNCNTGDKVKRGQVVGYSGTTGGSTGTHLHAELWSKPDRNGNRKELDPTFFFSKKKLKYLN